MDSGLLCSRQTAGVKASGRESMVAHQVASSLRLDRCSSPVVAHEILNAPLAPFSTKTNGNISHFLSLRIGQRTNKWPCTPLVCNMSTSKEARRIRTAEAVSIQMPPCKWQLWRVAKEGPSGVAQYKANLRHFFETSYAVVDRAHVCTCSCTHMQPYIYTVYLNFMMMYANKC